MTLETDDGGLVTLDTAEIRPSTGNTPMGTGSGGTSAGGPGNSGPSAGDQGTGGTTTTTGTGGGDTVASSGGRGQDQVRERSGHAGGSGGDQRGDDTGAVRGGGDAARAGAGMTNTGGAGQGRTPTLVDAGRTVASSWALDSAPARPIVVREKVKSLKLTKFKGLDDSMPVTMWRRLACGGTTPGSDDGRHLERQAALPRGSCALRGRSSSMVRDDHGVRRRGGREHQYAGGHATGEVHGPAHQPRGGGPVERTTADAWRTAGGVYTGTA
ncbi:hypothetical protein PF001_g31377 [Phytophthora fragariae]|uniref:Uncharacterized protein n=1 Tax=Phytophthora fragariae TaxID=53985 RepID=A0A6A4B1V2_9STRA|nr:hypothetical protein PF001_g31377 [Phytophthora fragariae]